MPAFIQITKGLHVGLTIGLTEKGGCTSIRQSIKQGRHGKQVDVHVAKRDKTPVRIYLRHPLKRLISAWRYFAPSMFPRESGIPQHATYEKFVDDVLRGVENEHWNPQLKMYEGCNITEIFRFENINDTWPSDIKLKHLNASYWKPPSPVQEAYRQDELQKHFAEDLKAWHAAN